MRKDSINHLAKEEDREIDECHQIYEATYNPRLRKNRKVLTQDSTLSVNEALEFLIPKASCIWIPRSI